VAKKRERTAKGGVKKPKWIERNRWERKGDLVRTMGGGVVLRRGQFPSMKQYVSTPEKTEAGGRKSKFSKGRIRGTIS